VALLRDAPAGLEVFLLRRSARQVFAASNYVYPGGAVDAEDHAESLLQCYGDGAVAQAEAIMDTEGALAYWAAAARECFEEAGVLVGCEAGRPPAADELSVARAALNAGTLSWHELSARLELHFAVDKLHYFAFWTTPPGMPRRFSTRFFAARMPAHQYAIPDGSETTHGQWLRPADALASCEQGEIRLMRPTIVTLRQFAQYEDSASALADLDQHEVVPCP